VGFLRAACSWFGSVDVPLWMIGLNPTDTLGRVGWVDFGVVGVYFFEIYLVGCEEMIEVLHDTNRERGLDVAVTKSLYASAKPEGCLRRECMNRGLS
jgi:hypothetical protein